MVRNELTTLTNYGSSARKNRTKPTFGGQDMEDAVTELSSVRVKSRGKTRAA